MSHLGHFSVLLQDPLRRFGHVPGGIVQSVATRGHLCTDHILEFDNLDGFHHLPFALIQRLDAFLFGHLKPKLLPRFVRRNPSDPYIFA
jgi:hypothetical protein